ncbi:Wzz/FepE/Etk N-terminal domain-containing protein, partial [Klebsiella pneumoniae]
MNTKDNRQQRSEANELELGRIVGELIDCRKLIIGITTGFTVIAVLYALMATPIYQANALIQVEQKQGNAILSSLSQMLPDGQLQSAPEISLLQSRMILGKTVDDLNLQTQVEKEYFPIIGKGISRILNNKNESIKIDKLYIERKEDSTDPEIIITIKD